MKNRIPVAVAAVAMAVLALAGCRSGSSASSTLHADATGTAAAQAKANYAPIIKQCGLGDAAGQIAFLKDLKSKAGRQAIWAKCGVPPQNQQAATDQALNAAEHAGLTKHGEQGKLNRQKYWAVTLPAIIKANQAAV